MHSSDTTRGLRALTLAFDGTSAQPSMSALFCYWPAPTSAPRMSDSASLTFKRRRISISGRREHVHDTSTDSDSAVDGDLLVGSPSLYPVDLRHKTAADPALLHFLDGYYIKRHTVEPSITSGGSCDVFTGYHPTFGKVAMKRPRMSGDESAERKLRSFISEGELWKKLRHTNVLQFVGMIRSDPYVWLVSVFAENGTLREYLFKHETADRHSLVFQFTSGLTYLHSENVVHGDLKSFNLFISSSHILLIGDFGLSKLRGMTTATSKKGAGSTPWMAPELLFEEAAAKTFSSDVYAYGITISEILRGELPFKEYTHQFALMKAMSENNVRPPTLPRESPTGKSYAILWDVAEECWDPEPSKRPSMVDVCGRFSLDYTSAIDGGTASSAIRSEELNQKPSRAPIPATGPETPLLIQNDSFQPPSVTGTTLSSSARAAHLLQLLGNADYGDISHMKEDGLCLEGTRAEILERLDIWADCETSPRVLLLKGQAGRGKSTIARSVASKFRERWGDDASSGIFHFRRSNDTLNIRFLQALARQLGCSGNQKLRAAILASLQAHQDVAQLRLDEQFDILLVQPLKMLDPITPHIFLVIDALDECSDRTLISALLRLIQKHATSLPSTVKFLLTTRPEEYIVAPFNASLDGVEEDLDTVDLAIIDRDVRAYFTVRLSEIQLVFGFEPSWVSPEAVNELVSLSQGLFQWAHAAMEYVREQPRSRLQRLVRSPTVALGLPALYQEILSTAFPNRVDVNDEDNLLGLIQHVVGSLVVAHRPMSPAILEYLWDHHPDHPPFSDPATEISESILGRLGSILILPSSPEGPIHFMHTSIRDFFTNPAQCTDARFLISQKAHHARLADICFRRMKRDLKHNICQVDDHSVMNSDILDLVQHRIPRALRYCCLSWSTHLSETTNIAAPDHNTLCAQLDEFCKKRMLHWLEVLSLTGVLSEVFDMLRRATRWVENVEVSQRQVNSQTTALLDDTYDFCRRFFKPMATNALHINLSCLLHFPNETMLRNVYGTSIGQQVPRIIRGPTNRRSDWRSVILTGSHVACVAFSPDGKTLASGLLNGIIQLWNTDTGQAKGDPLLGHAREVNSIMYSRDGRFLASGSSDHTVRLWNVKTGKQWGESLRGHIRDVNSVAFSPDGKILASGSKDCTTQLWIVATGERKWTLHHAAYVGSVVFSPDGEVLASASSDHTVRLWTVATGVQKAEPLLGHTQAVNSITFSPDGRILASGSGDRTVRLWNVDTGEQKGEPLLGHTREVTTVAFSPDGKTLASGSKDRTARLWSVSTGEQKGTPLFGHTLRITSVAFASDGKILASGSIDCSVRLWTVETGGQKADSLVGHTNCVNSVAFSPDGQSIASGSDDWTARLWTVATGKQKWAFHHGGRVYSVAFSPDGQILASGSGDTSAQLWTVATGKQKGRPLCGHTEQLRSLAFSPDGKILATASHDRTVRLWTVATGMQKGEPLRGHKEPVDSVTFSPSGKVLVSKSRNKIFQWMLDYKEPSTDARSDSKDSSVQPDVLITISNSPSLKACDRGWVFIRGKRCFWLPEEFYIDGDTVTGPVAISCSGGILVFHHRNIHILDISAFL